MELIKGVLTTFLSPAPMARSSAAPRAYMRVFIPRMVIARRLFHDYTRMAGLNTEWVKAAFIICENICV